MTPTPGRRSDRLPVEDFTYEVYFRLLSSLRGDHTNLRFGDLGDEPSRYFILRHDVDFSPDRALAMAERESEKGFRATYFLLLGSPFYNLLSPEYCTLPRKLVDLGHEVGLHYDLSAYETSGREPRKALRSEADLLSALSGQEVHSIAMHNPSIAGRDPFRKGTGFLNAYDPRYVREIAYFSDSAGSFREEARKALGRSDGPSRLQLLIHPFYWAGAPGDRDDRLKSFVRNRSRWLDDQASGLRDLWRRHDTSRTRTLSDRT